MRISGDLRNASLATALALLIGAPHAWAQVAIDRSVAADEGAQGFMFPGAVPAIRGFDIGYTRSDHQISRVMFGPRATSGPATGSREPYSSSVLVCTASGSKPHGCNE